MPASTPKLALPYPVAADPADVPADLLALATRLDTLEPWYATSLPGSPVDGQEVYYAADATNGVIWHLRYRAAQAAPYRWEFVGGPPLSVNLSQAEASTSGTHNAYQDLNDGTFGATLPLAGVYIFEFGAYLAAPSVITGYVAVKFSAAEASDLNGVLATINVAGTFTVLHHKCPPITVAAASQLVSLRFRALTNAVVNFGRRHLTMTPVRVG